MKILKNRPHVPGIGNLERFFGTYQPHPVVRPVDRAEEPVQNLPVPGTRFVQPEEKEKQPAQTDIRRYAGTAVIDASPQLAESVDLDPFLVLKKSEVLSRQTPEWTTRPENADKHLNIDDSDILFDFILKRIGR